MILTKLFWDINNDEVYIEVNGFLKLLLPESEEEKEVILPATPYDIIYPINYNLDKFEKESYFPKSSVKIVDLFNNIFSFYEKNATEESIKNLRALGIYEDTIKNEVSNIGEALLERVHFCGLEKIDENVYKVILSS